MIVSCSSCAAANRVPAARLTDRPRCARCKAQLSLAAPLEVRSAAELDELLSASKLPVLIDYWAAWCGPCRMVAPELEKLAAEREGRLLVVKVDTEALPQVAARHGIRSLPTLALYKEGREIKRVSGAMPKAEIAAQLGV